MTEHAPISLQLYTVRDALQEDFVGTIQKIADMGYVGVEPYGGMPVAAAEAAQILRDNGLTIHSAHLGLPESDNAAGILDAAAAYGIQRIIVPWLPPDLFKTADSIKAVCDRLNAAQRLISADGYTLGYHNHHFEFMNTDAGVAAYHIMLEHLDPQIFFELDTYWIQVGGHDPAEVVMAFGNRAPLLHIKDGPADKPESDMTAVGAGDVDIKGVVIAGEGSAEWLIVELDRCATDMMTAVADSYRYLINEGLAHGKHD
jgi:sugar phosphate isomerase/epimerase